LKKKQMNNENKSKKEKRKMKLGKKIVLIIIILLLIFASMFTYRVYKNGWGLSGMIATVVGHDENTKKDLGELKLLILGISTDQENVNLTDTIMIASYNPNTQKATIISIPRDTYTGTTPSKATPYEKINALYSRKNRPDETLEAVNKITGLDIEYYIVVKTEGLIELVDVIGGVTFDVPIDMTYDDPTQDLQINLKAGTQLLDGEKAEQLVRFRHNNNGTTYPEEYGDNDTGRMRTQREFITQVLKQTLKPSNIFKLGGILDVANNNITTNIDLNVAKDYLPYAVEFNTESLITGVIPGENTNKNNMGTWVFVHNQTETKSLIKEMFYSEDEEKTQISEEDNTTENYTQNNKSEIKIEVLNGSGTNSTLQKVTSELKEAGYNVTRTGSTNTTAKTTIINKKSVKESILKNIKETLKTGTISESESSSSKVDITIIVGKDY